MNESNNGLSITLLKEENENLKKTIQELSILNEIATAVTATQSVTEIEDLIIKKCIKHLMVEEGVIMLLNDSDESGSFTTMLRTRNSILDSLPYQLDDQLTGWMLKNKTVLLINNFAEDKRFNIGNNSLSQIKSLLCVPMFIKARMIGLITLFNKINTSFTEGDKRLLSICASQSAQIIENARLYEIETVLKKVKKEIELAAKIQYNLLPKSDLVLNNISITGKTIPAKDVGGDFYDFIPLPDHKIAVWLGDISGKGMPAALLMANLQGVLRSQTIIDSNCKSCLKKANETMVQNSEDDKFATLFYAIINTDSNRINYISAGHNTLLYIDKSGAIKNYDSEDLPIGIYPDIAFKEKTIDMKPGDMLVVYSDGITETENADEENFQIDRLRELLSLNIELAPADLIEKIFSNVHNFSGKSEQSDDQTLLIIKLD